MKLDISVYGIVDPQIARGRSLAELARAAADGGATIIQFRAKMATTQDMINEARAIVQALARTNVALLVNDRVDVALAAGAQGVHVGREDMTPADARSLLGPAAIIGVTVKNAADLSVLDPKVASYGCIGGVFATAHKDNPDAPVGLDGFATLRREARRRFPSLPVGAIAGITTANAADVIRAGADGVAVIGAMFGRDDVAGDTRRLAEVVRAAKRAKI